MYKIIFFVALLTVGLKAHSQSLNLLLKSTLNQVISETSGLVFVNGRLITHNDSGNESKLYEVDTATGYIPRNIQIQNATNVDWEDLASDGQYLYIGDFGNNNGNRTNLKIYKISLQDLLNSNMVMAQTIEFNYSDQTNFNSRSFHNYDAEALLAFNNQLYIFTKNRANFKTYIYPLSKTPGQYAISKTDSLNVNGLVTGVDANSLNGNVVLIGYDFFSPFAYEIVNPGSGPFSVAPQKRISLVAGGQTQIEAIAHQADNRYWISSESTGGSAAKLYTLNIPTTLDSDSYDYSSAQLWKVVQNGKRITIESKSPFEAQLIDVKGRMWKLPSTPEIDLNHLSCGRYILFLRETGKANYQNFEIVIQP